MSTRVPLYEVDRELVHQVLARDAGAAARFAVRLQSLARFLHGRGARATDDEVVHLVTALVQALPEYRGAAPLETWIAEQVERLRGEADAPLARYYAALRGLPAEQARLLRMLWSDQLEPDAIALRLDLDPGWVGAQLAAGEKALGAAAAAGREWGRLEREWFRSAGTSPQDRHDPRLDAALAELLGPLRPAVPGVMRASPLVGLLAVSGLALLVVYWVRWA